MIRFRIMLLILGSGIAVAVTCACQTIVGASPGNALQGVVGF